MAPTFTFIAGTHKSVANEAERDYTVTFDSSYPTGGEAVTAANFGLRRITKFIPHGAFTKSDGSDAVVVRLVSSNLLAFRGDGNTAGQLAQVPNTTDLSAYSGRVTVRGT